MRFIFVLALTALITVSVGTVVKESRNQGQKILISPLIAGTSTDTVDSSYSTNPDYYNGWQTFVNNFYHYKIRHPADVTNKNSRNGDIVLQKGKAFSLNITQRSIAEKDTINTIIEKDIDQKKSKNNLFTQTSDISPVAISSHTAETYSSLENNDEFLYFYLPQTSDKFLFVSIKSDGTDDTLAEKIVYSLEFIP